ARSSPGQRESERGYSGQAQAGALTGQSIVPCCYAERDPAVRVGNRKQDEETET
ncbi:hypothetical protein BaRGS_00035074, partial [Batillaria attramentaria]